MKKSILLPILFFLYCSNSISFCMQNNQIVSVNHFDAVSPDMKNKIFACAEPCEKNNLMRTNKEWHVRGHIWDRSIKNGPFGILPLSSNFICIMRHSPLIASKEDKLLIWQRARGWDHAYLRNDLKVDIALANNIWNNSSKQEQSYLLER